MLLHTHLVNLGYIPKVVWELLQTSLANYNLTSSPFYSYLCENNLTDHNTA